MTRALIVLPLVACAACAAPAEPPAVPVAFPAAAPAVVSGDCRSFTSSALVAGATQHMSGTACRQSDGSWRITAESPTPEAAIAMAGPLLTAEESSATAAGVWYAFDSAQHRVSFFDTYTGGPGGYAVGGGFFDGFDGFGGFRHRGFHRHRGFARGLGTTLP